VGEASADPDVRRRALDFIRSIIDIAGPLGAPAIIGSMQGRTGEGVDRKTALHYLGQALEILGERAEGYDVPVLFEPLNRYETDLVNTVEAGVALLRPMWVGKARLLIDLFHMNIEESDIAAAVRAGGDFIGHLHFVDSNRRPAGCGHLDYAPVARALADIGYDGFASAEALPHPDSDAAAAKTIESFRRHFRPGAPER
jgi:sugar phosphate isomerase/epimerase